MDAIVELQELALASRLRRTSDRLLEDASVLYSELGIPFQARWFPAFWTLSRHAPLPVTQMAQRLGLSHPAVTQLAAQLIGAGLVVETRDPHDDRRRLLGLSPEGRSLRLRLEPVWNAIRAAARELLEEAGVDLVHDLDQVDRVHARASVVDRARTRLGLPGRTRLAIVDYRPAYKKHFRALNLEWLGRRYPIEAHDAWLLDDPNVRIIRKGGRILFARLDEEIVGTCALVRHRDRRIELCKMAVTERLRGQGIGTTLVRAASERTRGMGEGVLYLRTDPHAKDLMRFYRRLGFRRAGRRPLPGPEYARGSVTLQLDLNTTDRQEKEKDPS